MFWGRGKHGATKKSQTAAVYKESVLPSRFRKAGRVASLFQHVLAYATRLLCRLQGWVVRRMTTPCAFQHKELRRTEINL